MKTFLKYKTLALIMFASMLFVPTAMGQTNDCLKAQASVGANQEEQSEGDLWRRTELYFGTKKPDDTEVTEEEFNRFVDEKVTQRFPDGLTILTGNGQFRNSTGAIIKERSKVLILFYPLQMRDANRKIQEIREAYKRAFNQESVLRVDNLALVSF